MRVLLIATAELKDELLSGETGSHIHIEWIPDYDNLDTRSVYDACIDLLFENDMRRINWLKSLQVPLVIINSVSSTLQDIQEDFVRINAWNSFLKRPIVEAAATTDAIKVKAEELFSGLGKKTEWVPDIAGFLTARVIASIINEAYFTLEEDVSTPEEIDIAMKLGTNYPWGPFEWSKKIGLVNICSLLETLAKTQPGYKPSSLLKKTALN